MKSRALVIPVAAASAQTIDSSLGFCGVGGDVPSSNEAQWGPVFKAANINWFWNWDIQAKSTDYVPQGWGFLPNVWASGTYPMNPSASEPHQGAGASTYDLAPILLGWNEPDIVGMCISDPSVTSPSSGYCQEAGSMGWWFPDLIKNPTSKMADWYKQYDDAKSKGYEITSPMVAVETGDKWLAPFVRASCSTNRCPQYLSWHFYVSGCYDSDDQLEGFVTKMNDSMALIKEFPSIKGIILTELGLLKVAGGPATCPDSTLVGVVEKLFAIMRRSDYAINGQSIVKHIAWFSKDGAGSTYDLALVDPSSGQVRPVGTAYADQCKQWSEASNSLVVI